MSSSPMTARHYLLQEITAALSNGASGEEVLELVIRTGWQPRPTPDPNSDYLEGVLDDGRHVPIEIRRAEFSRLSS